MPQSRRGPPPPAASKSSSSSSRGKQSDRKKNTTTVSNINVNRNEAKNPKAAIDPRVLSQFKTILNTFQHTFSHLFDTPDLPQIIQSVKHSLYLRDYVAAFDSPEKLQAYVVRWSVARALAYFEMIAGGWWSDDVTRAFYTTPTIPAHSNSTTTPNGSSSSSSKGEKRLSITCIGGGAGAEIVGMAAAYSFLNPPVPDITSTEEGSQEQEEKDEGRRGLDLTLLDFATWAPITDSLYTTLTDPTKKESNVFLEKSGFSAKCHQQDVLTPLSDTTISSISSADIVTILFTAGELYSQSPTATTKFFMSLHALTKPGALLVVVDSAGGFEDLDVLKENKNNTATSSGGGGSKNSDSMGGYKLGFLLDKTLTNRDQWQTIASHDAKWWRVPQGLKDSSGYPLELENMRCLIRVYRRNES
ncbi:hypothetical protein TWF481_007810 [Arthrobotrys musiformis]|uniref:25S rRNA (Uridine(2843)-N(3))-methyltransferase n=1 Tax=Arthrobotrys musiformis TaxID=47236 RepID=A0AAV9W5F0_9PEZI